MQEYIGRLRPPKHSLRKEMRIEALEPRTLLIGDSVVVFNEVMYNPAGPSDAAQEWLEVYNQHAVDIDLSGWKVSGGVQFTFPEGTTIAGRDYVVVAADPEAVLANTQECDTCQIANVFGPFTGRLNNGGERLQLLDNNDRIMNTLDYDDQGEWPSGPDGSGASLTKTSPTGNSEDSGNWTHSRLVGGTPGDANMVPAPGTVVINEISGAAADQFWMEIANRSDSTADLTGYTLVGSANDEGRHTLASTVLEPGEFLVLDETALRFSVSVGEAIFLYGPSESELVDARRASERLAGVSTAHDGRWLYPDRATPGKANSFDFNDDIVINEIFYHAPPQLSLPDTQPTFDRSRIVPIDSEGWRYNRTGDALDFDWATNSHPVDNERWFQGQAPLGIDQGELPMPFNTEFPRPRDNDPRFITYYFETDFTLTADLFDSSEIFELQHYINDGAIFYLNGKEFHRFHILDRPVDASTRASINVSLAEISKPYDIPRDLLRVGTNTLSAEVHLRSSGSADIAFAAELLASVQATPLVPGRPFVESDEEWLELYNRGEDAVDITGWSFRDAIEFEFPADTLIAPGDYLVVAKDKAALAAKYPDITIIGDYAGRLSGDNDNILLVDEEENPADEVDYHDSGRWGTYADGGGSSLELRDPHADNSKAEAWANSDQASKSEWVTFTSRRVAQPYWGEFRSTIGSRVPPVQFNDFVFGFLDAGEVLLDDIHVIEDPDGAALELIQNSTFEDGSTWWRVGGNHEGEVVADPDNPDNNVLRLRAYGSGGYVSNSAETTFVDNRRIAINQEYEVSFRAKWIGGSRQLNNRAWFTMIPETTLLQSSELYGTPGAQNSHYESNIGPTFHGLNHSPVIPDQNEPVTVSVTAGDPDNVKEVNLWYSTGSEFSSLQMNTDLGGRYRATIPGQLRNTIVQFYVEAIDGKGNGAMFPERGADSKALYEVNPSSDVEDIAGALERGVDSLRIVMVGDDCDFMHSNTNLMSAGNLRATLVVNESEVFYDIGVRLRGSQHSRDASTRVGFVLTLEPDQLYRGVHQRFSIDRSTRANNTPGPGPAEIIIRQFMNHAGGVPSEYEDIIQVIAPKDRHNSPAALRLAEFGPVYLDTQFENGNDGALFELEMIFTPPGFVDRDPNNPKRHTGGPFYDYDFEDLGPDKELYRFHLNIKSNRQEDDYSRLIEAASAISLAPGPEFDAAVSKALDVDQWMRVFATKSLTLDFDGYGSTTYRHNQNVMFYVRPVDNRVIAMPWDIDGVFNTGFVRVTNPLWPSGAQGITNLTDLIQRPQNLRLYYGHLHDMIETTWNPGYMLPWMEHFGAKAGQDLTENIDLIEQRGNHVLDNLPPEFSPHITTSSPLNVGAAHTATIAGRAWINVRELRLPGNDRPLEVTWLPVEFDEWADGFEVIVPVDKSTQQVTLEAYDFHGNLIEPLSIAVNSSVVDPVANTLRITEINYNPQPARIQDGEPNVDNDQFEFIELTNVGDATIDLAGVQLVEVDEKGDNQGITFQFAHQTLETGESIVVTNDVSSFQSRYGNAIRVAAGDNGNGGPASQYSGRLSNDGERITLLTASGVAIQQFKYDDAWYPDTDGGGSSLQVVDATQSDLGVWGKATGWRASALLGGTPGIYISTAEADFDANGIVDVADIDQLWDEVNAGSNGILFDLTGDSLVNDLDVTQLVEQILVTRTGDTDLSGDVTFSDFVTLANNFGADATSWSAGDFDGDGRVGNNDFVMLAKNFGYRRWL